MSSCRVFVGRLPNRATERDVEHFFRHYGKIRDVVIKQGYGFVEFSDARDADDAIHDMNGREMLGARIVVEMSQGGPRSRDVKGYAGGGRGIDDRVGYNSGGIYSDRGPSRNSRFPPPLRTRNRLVVENLSTRCSWQDLKDMMRSYGEVTYADAHRDTRNEGIVCFTNRSDLKYAMRKCQGKEINGRKIKLIDDSGSPSPRRSRSPHAASRSRSPHGGGKRSPNRSRSPHGGGKRSPSRSRSPPNREKRNRMRSLSRSVSRGRSRSPCSSRSRSHSPTGERENDDRREPQDSTAARSPCMSPSKKEDLRRSPTEMKKEDDVGGN